MGTIHAKGGWITAEWIIIIILRIVTVVGMVIIGIPLMPGVVFTAALWWASIVLVVSTAVDLIPIISTWVYVGAVNKKLKSI